MDTRVKILVGVAAIIAAITFIALKPAEQQPQILFGAGSTTSPEFVGGADATAQTNTGGGVQNFGATTGERDIFIVGDYAYIVAAASSSACVAAPAIASNGCEFKIFDITTPSAPVYVGGGDASGGTNTGTTAAAFTSVFVSGDYAYITKSNSITNCNAADKTGCELQVWDVSTPAIPTFVGGGDATGTTNAGTGSVAFSSVYVSGNYAYVAVSGNATNCNTAGDKRGCELQVWDVSTPASPTFVGGADASGATNAGTGNSSFQNVTISGSLAYVGKVGDATNCNTVGNKVGCELQIYNVSTPATPTFVGGVDSAGQTNAGVGAVAINTFTISNGYGFAGLTASSTACTISATSAANGCELKIFDLASTTAPSYVGGGDTSGSTNSGTQTTSVFSIFVSGNYLYLAKGANTTDCSGADKVGCEFQIWDITTKSTPTFLGAGDAGGGTNTGTGNSAMNGIQVSGNYAFINIGGAANDCSTDPVGCELQVWEVASTPATASLKHDVIFFD